MLEASRRLEALEAAARKVMKAEAAEAEPKAPAAPEPRPQAAEEVRTPAPEPRPEPAPEPRPGPEKEPAGKAPAPEEEPADTAPHNAVFRRLSAIAPLPLLVLLALLCWAPVLTGDLACPGEAANLKALTAMKGLDFLPHAGTSVLLPGYAWFAWGFSQLVPLGDPFGTTMLSFLGGLIGLMGVCILAGSLRLGRSAVFGAGLVLLSLPLFAGSANFVGPVPSACGLACLALACLAPGWTSSFDLPRMILGNVFAAAAALSGGLYFGLVPLATSLVFGLWRGGIQRMRNTDAVAGFACFVILIAAWMAVIILFGDGGVTTAMLLKVLGASPSAEAFGCKVSTLAAASLPFLLVVICVNWPRVLRESVRTLKASREENANACLWIGLVFAIVLLPFSAGTADCLLAVCLLAIVTARALLRLGKKGVRLFFLLLCLVLVLCTVAGFCATLPFVRDLVLPALGVTLPKTAMDVLTGLAGMNMAAAIALPLLPLIAAAAILHVAWRSRTAAAPLLCTALAVAVMAQPLALVLPSTLAAIPACQLKATAGLVPPVPAQAPAMTKKAAPAKQVQPAGKAPETAPAAKPAETKAPAPEAVKPAETKAPAAETKAPAPEAAKPAETKAPAPEAKPAAPADKAPEAAPAGKAPEAAPAEGEAAPAAL